MPNAEHVLTAFREELIAAGLVRRPSDAGAAVPLHVMPADGPPAPGEREGIEDHPTLVASLLESGTFAESNFDAATRRRVVLDVRLRAKDTTAVRQAMGLEAAIAARLIRPETNYGYGFELGTDAALFCHQATPTGGGPLASSLAAGFDRVAKWTIEVNPG